MGDLVERALEAARERAARSAGGIEASANLSWRIDIGATVAGSYRDHH